MFVRPIHTRISLPLYLFACCHHAAAAGAGVMQFNTPFCLSFKSLAVLEAVQYVCNQMDCGRFNGYVQITLQSPHRKSGTAACCVSVHRYVLKSQMKELLELEAKNAISIEEEIENERKKVDAKTPITEEVGLLLTALALALAFAFTVNMASLLLQPFRLKCIVMLFLCL